MFATSGSRGRSPAHRLSRLLAIGAGFLTFSSLAQADVILQENFSSGLGRFTSSGPVTTNAFYGVRLYGSFGSSDGVITSPSIDTRGFTNIRASYSRDETGMDFNEGGVVEYSVNGGLTFQKISDITGTGPVSFALPADAAGKATLHLRFRVNASSSGEYLTVDNVLVEGTGSAPPPPATPPSPPSPPGTCDTNPLCRGPEPTVPLLETAGPFQTASYVVPNPSGYGSGTIYYPVNPGGRVGAVVVVPGLNAPQSSIQSWGSRLASHGFVTITIGTNSPSDGIPARAAQQLAALRQVVALSNGSGNPIAGRVDGTRLGVMGWSLGGGASLTNARDNPPNVRASVPLAPTNLAGLSAALVPTMILACQNDAVLPVNTNALASYNSMTNNKKAYLVVRSGGHSCANNPAGAGNALGKYGVAWMKRWLDNDLRYSKFLCGPVHEADLATEASISSYRQNCPY
jgi:dienelactone hydrolase